RNQPSAAARGVWRPARLSGRRRPLLGDSARRRRSRAEQRRRGVPARLHRGDEDVGIRGTRHRPVRDSRRRGRAAGAMTLVAGFVVAMPAHRGDNTKDSGTPGPESWKRRPAEISHAIDAVAQDARFARLLTLDKVGMYGMSAGGHTALSLAGGRWSPARFTQH